MTVEEAVADKLLTTGAVTALVSTRITQLIVPQHSAFPAIRVQLIDEPIRYHLRGNVDLTAARVQVDAFAKIGSSDAYLSATTIADAVRDALTIEGWSVGSPSRLVQAAFLMSRRVMFESDEFRLVRVMQDFRVWSKES